LFLRNAGRELVSTWVPQLDIREAFKLDLTLQDRNDKKLPFSWGRAYLTRDPARVGGLDLQLPAGDSHELPAVTIVIEPSSPSRDPTAVLDVSPGQFCRLSFQ